MQDSFAKTMQSELADAGYKFNVDAIKNAVFQGLKELQNYKNTVLIKGEETLKEIQSSGASAVVLAGRPYHIDNILNLSDKFALTVACFVLFFVADKFILWGF